MRVVPIAMRWLSFSAFLLGACAGPMPTAEPEAPAGLSAPPGESGTGLGRPALATNSAEAVYRSRAESLMARRDWAAAAVQWELLTLLRPDVSDYAAQLLATRKRIADALPERLRAGQVARQRGDVDQATAHYLRALSLDPLNEAAARALREIELERTRRSELGRLPRPVVAGATASSRPAGRSDAEAGIALFRQGDYLGAIQSLQRYLQTDRRDAFARGYLADAFFLQGNAFVREGRREDALFYYERALASGYADKSALQAVLRTTRQALAEEYFQLGIEAAATDPDRASFLWERSLGYDPGHAQAASRLNQARQRTASGNPK